MRRVLAVAALLMLSACSHSAAGRQAESAFAERAEQIAGQWNGADATAATAGFMPLEDLVTAPATPDGDAKQAVANGWFAAATLPADGPATGTVAFDDGSTLEVATLGPTATYDVLADGLPPKCDPTGECLAITGATATTARLLTSRGMATVPAYAFAVAGLADPVVRVSVAPQAIARPPRIVLAELGPASTLAGAMSVQSADGNRIDFTVGVGRCDTGIEAAVWENDQIIVVGATLTPPDGGNCDMALDAKALSATLRRPAGDRIVVDVATGALVRPIS